MCTLSRLALVGAIIVLSTRSCGTPRFAAGGDRAVKDA